MADKHRQRKYKQDGEEPYTHNSGYWVKHHFAGDKEFDVLNHNHRLWANEYEEHLPQNATYRAFAHFSVVVAVSGHAGCDVVNKPEGQEAKNLNQMFCFKRSDGCKAPKSVIGQEEVI